MSSSRISDLLEPALRGLGVRGRVREEQLRLALHAIVGAKLAPLCRVERLDHGALVIATANSALAHQLQMDSPRVIDALNARIGSEVVRRLRFSGLAERSR